VGYTGIIIYGVIKVGEKRLAVMNKTVKVITFLPESDIIVPLVVLIDPLKQPETAQEYGLKKDSLGFMYPAITFSKNTTTFGSMAFRPDMSLQHFWTTSYCFQQVM